MIEAKKIKQINKRLILAGAAAAIGCVVGYFVAKDSSKIDNLQAEIRRLQLMLDQTRRSGFSQRVRTPSAIASRVLTSTTNTPNPEEPKPLSPREREAKYRRDALDALVANTAAASSDEYTSVFSQLGAGPEITERLKSNLAQLHQKAIAAGEPYRDLIAARVAYDQSVQSALGEENYIHYRIYEESKPAVREYQLLEKYAGAKNIAVDPAFSEKMIQLIKDAGATTTETWHGPYDPLPRPAVGQEMVTNQLNQALIALMERSKILLESARQSGIPDEYSQLLANYYADRIHEKTQGLEFSSLPAEERRRQADKFFEAQIEKQRQEQERKRPLSKKQP